MNYSDKVRDILNETCQPRAQGESGADHALNAERYAAATEFGKLLTCIGPELQPATLENYIATTQKQKQVLAVCDKYANNAELVSAEGSNLILYGGMGTGKDHLCMGVAKRLHRLRKIIVWVDGIELQMRMGECLKGASDRAMLSEYIAPDYLWISNPVINGIGLQPFQMRYFHAIIDGRYRQQKPTMLTVNATDSKMLSALLEGPAVDRLKSNSIALPCDWESYREADRGERLPTAEIPEPLPPKYDPPPNPRMSQRFREKLKKLKPFVAAEEEEPAARKPIRASAEEVFSPVELDAEDLAFLAGFPPDDDEAID